uniref:Reverse transcriptase Ty1/copia-type domain-containing protein n=1 Tax=Manihot esculenta TaxID=3983 RepID=A0A2C9UC07_MANES
MSDADLDEFEEKCVRIIQLCIADNIVNNVIDEDSAMDIWEKLEKLYMSKSLFNKLYLKCKLYQLKMVEGGNLVEHLNEFNRILNQLAKVDVKIKKKDKALLFLGSLHDL